MFSLSFSQCPLPPVTVKVNIAEFCFDAKKHVDCVNRRLENCTEVQEYGPALGRSTTHTLLLVRSSSTRCFCRNTQAHVQSLSQSSNLPRLSWSLRSDTHPTSASSSTSKHDQEATSKVEKAPHDDEHRVPLPTQAARSVVRPLESFVGPAQSNGLLRCPAIRALLDTVENEVPEYALERRRSGQHSNVPSEVLQDLHEIVEESHRRFNLEHQLYFSQPADLRTFQTRARASSRLSVEFDSLVNGFLLSLFEKNTPASPLTRQGFIPPLACSSSLTDQRER